MAKLDDQIEVSVQGVDKHNQWCMLQEFDFSETTKEGASTYQRWSTGIYACPGRFRFCFRFSESFLCEGANGVKIELTFNQGGTINAYPLTFIKRGCGVDHLATTNNVKCLKSLASGHLVGNIKEITLPRPRSSPRDRWCKAQFNFRPVGGIGPDTTSQASKKPHALHAAITVLIFPCSIGAGKDRDIAHNINADARKLSTDSCMVPKDVTLEADVTYTQENVDKRPRALTWDKINRKLYTFVFHYRQPEMVDEVEVEVERKGSARLFPKSNKTTQLESSIAEETGSTHKDDTDTAAGSRRTSIRTRPSSPRLRQSRLGPSRSMSRSQLYHEQEENQHHLALHGMGVQEEDKMGNPPLLESANHNVGASIAYTAQSQCLVADDFSHAELDATHTSSVQLFQTLMNRKVEPEKHLEELQRGLLREEERVLEQMQTIDRSIEAEEKKMKNAKEALNTIRPEKQVLTEEHMHVIKSLREVSQKVAQNRRVLAMRTILQEEMIHLGQQHKSVDADAHKIPKRTRSQAFSDDADMSQRPLARN